MCCPLSAPGEAACTWKSAPRFSTCINISTKTMLTKMINRRCWMDCIIFVLLCYDPTWFVILSRRLLDSFLFSIGFYCDSDILLVVGYLMDRRSLAQHAGPNSFCPSNILSFTIRQRDEHRHKPLARLVVRRL